MGAAGGPSGPDRTAEAVRALGALDVTSRADVYWAGRLTLCRGPDDLARYDRVFDAVIAGDYPRSRLRSVPPLRAVAVVATGQGPGSEPDEDPAAGTDLRVLRASASRTELLRHRDVATLTAEERRLLNEALSALSLAGQTRPSRRFRPAPRGRIDRGRTVRELLRNGGEVAALRRRRHTTRPRPVVILVDVSGSMSPYADALLRFAHAATRRRRVRTEVFTIGTRLTRVTREMASPDAEAAMAAVSAAVPDWSGGTRLGELLKEFLDRWGQRGTARGAVMVLLSDGWERGDAALLGEQMARLRRLARRVVWANPRKAVPGYAPLAAGMAAALPYVDEFVEGHSLAALERLARAVAGGSCNA
ncbi:MAG: VWA domain-containing protein [Actinomycetota bacterium]|nr:VWA domain-containing protein [Actinomycetota bacterium]